MSFDLSTLLAITVFSSAVAGCLLLLAWVQHRTATALALWGAAFLTAAAATALIAARGRIPDIWSIVVANAILATAYGTMWYGVRNFEGRQTRLPRVLAGSGIWLAACVFPPFYATPVARAVLMAVIGVSYTLLCVFELWRARKEKLASRWPIMVLLAGHAAAIPVRIPLVGSRAGTSFHVDLLTFVVFETLFLSICGAFLFGSLVKERILLWYRDASLVDPLTGVANRRAFFEKGTRLIQRSVSARTPAALLLFDLDAFKSINDRFGHAVGDAVLTAFCQIASAQLRPMDLFARMGGEEFVVSDERQLVEAAQKRLDAARVFPRQVFVFIHGFNVSFENALRRTAQIAYDLNFDGAPFLFSWPGGDGLLSYLRVNAGNAKTATDHLTDFLEKVVAQTNATKIHLIAHSMGNTVLLDALDIIKRTSGNQSPLRFAEIILHSPDVCSDRFAQVMTAIKGIGAGATLYSSTQDRALGLSALLSCEKAGASASVFPGVETIDVTAAGSSFLGLNHDIYVTNPAIFNDMRVVLELGNHPPDKRSPVLFQPQAAESGTYWLYHRPQAGDASVDTIALPVVAPRPEIAASPYIARPVAAPVVVYPVPVAPNPIAAPGEQPAQNEPEALEPPATVPAAATPPQVPPLPSPANETASPRPVPPQAAPTPGPDGTTASIATPPNGTVKRKKRKPDFDPDWNTKPLR